MTMQTETYGSRRMRGTMHDLMALSYVVVAEDEIQNWG